MYQETSQELNEVKIPVKSEENEAKGGKVICLLPVSPTKCQLREDKDLALSCSGCQRRSWTPLTWLLTSPSMLLIRTSSLRISKAPWIRSSRFMPFSLAKVSSNPFSASSNVCCAETENAWLTHCPQSERTQANPIHMGVRVPAQCLVPVSSTILTHQALAFNLASTLPIPQGRYHYSPILINKKIEAQRNYVTCPRSHSKAKTRTQVSYPIFRALVVVQGSLVNPLVKSNQHKAQDSRERTGTF